MNAMKTSRWLVLGLFFVACGGGAVLPPPPAPPPLPSGSVAPPIGSAPAATQCAGAAPGPGWECMQDCGPPVARETDPPPPWRWLSPQDAANRKQYHCPICLPAEARIATPDGERPISELTVGARVLTVDASGRRVEARVLYMGSTPAGAGHHVVRVTLADGRVVTGSAGHPTAHGTLGALRAKDVLDGATVTSVEVLPFTGERTWDLLPSGPTGLYVADGVVLKSTFAR